jgi:RNA polymerase sigma factor (sigma-70 family)
MERKSRKVRDKGRIEELALRYKESRDEATFGLLYESCRGLVLEWSRGMGLDSDLEDVEQEVWLLVFRKIGLWESRGNSFLNWLYVLTRNVVRMWHRSRNRELEGRSSYTSYMEYRRSADELRCVLELERRLRILDVERLSREVLGSKLSEIVSYRVQGLSPAVVAELLGKSRGSICVSFHRGVHRLLSRMSCIA